MEKLPGYFPLKIGLANRDSILSSEHIRKHTADLHQLGVKNVEFSIPADRALRSGEATRILLYKELGFEVSIHAEGKLFEHLPIWGEFRRQIRSLKVTSVVYHPCEHLDSRQKNQEATQHLCCFTSGSADDMPCCLENLPYTETVPSRFGDTLSELFEVVAQCDMSLCFNTGHYLAAAQARGPVERLNKKWAKRVKHIHLHSVVNGEGHQWPHEDDGDLADLVDEFLDLNPTYDGVWSLDCRHPDNPLDSLKRSVEWLATNVRLPVA